jgi:hypothetical protein
MRLCGTLDRGLAQESTRQARRLQLRHTIGQAGFDHGPARRRQGRHPACDGLRFGWGHRHRLGLAASRAALAAAHPPALGLDLRHRVGDVGVVNGVHRRLQRVGPRRTAGQRSRNFARAAVQRDRDPPRQRTVCRHANHARSRGRQAMLAALNPPISIQVQPGMSPGRSTFNVATCRPWTKNG